MTSSPAFAFSTVAHIVSEAGAACRLGQYVQQHFPTARQALLVTDPGFLATGLVNGPRDSLLAAGIQVHLYTDVVADPPEHVVLEAVATARRHEADIVIGLGGGSSMDVAKLIAVLAGGGQQLADIYGIGNVRGKAGGDGKGGAGRLPLVQIPTTAGTGSEVTNIAIVTTGATSKMGVVAPQLYADLAILDAELTLGLPARITAATGIDAMVHAIEAYTSRHKKNPLSDMLARQALELLSANLLRACENGADLAARQAMLLGAMLAGQAFANAPVAAVHALAYPIGGIFHVAHGLSNSLVLPHVLRFNAPAAAPLYAELAAIVVPQASGSVEARAEALTVAMQQIAILTGIERTLLQVGIKESDLERLADEAMLQTRLLGNNPREVTRADARAIYAAAL
ncbi:iron-containing alcohol dehydrogenase [Rugamonas sp. CCM 8940]|uniref:iron-containing alcohol dehydrogenase n=1 Tax=Rugamonas sp. CCM 8940 TaxID=2765359 RepID=UPI0018F58B28|nr:iron-containing alcohol dehydrogenase [Rugamonas sp. CCM 8940]MBJ7309337.1 iron-containing alcohol dehydrogenase [Rugamonas sp. CCM 8940]